MGNTLEIVIDGKTCTCESGEYLYDVAKRNGIFIPVLCRSDAFEDHRACCRVCIVEVEIRGRTKVVTACVYPVEQECIVRTKSERILRERAVIMSLLAHRAPESDLIAGMARGMGAGEDLDRLVSLDSGKCILCGLCVQACNSLGTGAISTVNRGTDKMIDTPYGRESAACVGCLSCANVCPTGAIEYTQTSDSRTIWNRTFSIVKCEQCGAPMGTPEAIAHASTGVGEDAHTICGDCRKRQLADSMMETYKNVSSAR